MPIEYNIKEDYLYKKGEELGLEKGQEIGEKLGLEKGKEIIISQMLTLGQYKVEEIALITQMDVQRIEDIQRKLAGDKSLL